MRAAPLFAALILAPACVEGDPRDVPLPCGDAVRRLYVIDRIEPPPVLDTPDGLTLDAIDLSGDGLPDDGLGRARDTLASVIGEPDPRARWTAAAAARVEAGLSWLVEVEACRYQADAHVRLRPGRRDDAGAIRPAGAPRIPAAGTFDGARLEAYLGEGAAPLGALADLTGVSATRWYLGDAFAVELDVAGDTLEGRLAGALGPGYLDALAWAYLPLVRERAAAGDLQALTADANGDGRITEAELRASLLPFMFSLPDVDVLDAQGRFTTAPDGLPESLSFGLRIRATEVPAW